MDGRDFLLEKAFNQIISDNGSRCCVCSVCESPSPFVDFSQCELRSHHSEMMTEQHSDEERLPLTVVVKRSMVKLPESLERSGSSHDQQQLITCQTCDICVHKCECKYVIVCVLYSNYMARSMSIKSRFQMEFLTLP